MNLNHTYARHEGAHALNPSMEGRLKRTWCEEIHFAPSTLTREPSAPCNFPPFPIHFR